MHNTNTGTYMLFTNLFIVGQLAVRLFTLTYPSHKARIGGRNVGL